MQAAVYEAGGPNKWWKYRDDLALPAAAPDGKVLVKVMAASLNPLDYKIPKLPVINRFVKGKPIGEDFAGVVVESKCSSYNVGDEVFGFGDPMSGDSGTLCTRFVADPSRIALKPRNLTFTEAAAMPLAAVTSLQTLRDFAEAGPGKRILLIGASGGTGTFAVQIAKALGAHVTAICSGKNAELVHKLGADEVHDYTSGSAVPAGVAAFDAVYDMVSSADPQDYGYEAEARPLLKPGGKYLAINGSQVDFLRSLISDRVGFNLQRRNFAIVEYKQRGSDLDWLAKCCDAGKLKPMVAKELPFTESGVVEAFGELRSRRLRGKVVLAMDNAATSGLQSRL